MIVVLIPIESSLGHELKIFFVVAIYVFGNKLACLSFSAKFAPKRGTLVSAGTGLNHKY